VCLVWCDLGHLPWFFHAHALVSGPFFPFFGRSMVTSGRVAAFRKPLASSTFEIEARYYHSRLSWLRFLGCLNIPDLLGFQLCWTWELKTPDCKLYSNHISATITSSASQRGLDSLEHFSASWPSLSWLWNHYLIASTYSDNYSSLAESYQTVRFSAWDSVCADDRSQILIASDARLAETPELSISCSILAYLKRYRWNFMGSADILHELQNHSNHQVYSYY